MYFLFFGHLYIWRVTGDKQKINPWRRSTKTKETSKINVEPQLSKQPTKQTTKPSTGLFSKKETGHSEHLLKPLYNSSSITTKYRALVPLPTGKLHNVVSSSISRSGSDVFLQRLVNGSGTALKNAGEARLSEAAIPVQVYMGSFTDGPPRRYHRRRDPLAAAARCLSIEITITEDTALAKDRDILYIHY